MSAKAGFDLRDPDLPKQRNTCAASGIGFKACGPGSQNQYHPRLVGNANDQVPLQTYQVRNSKEQGLLFCSNKPSR